MLAACQRTPAARREVWRLATALLVQEGGLVGAVSNLAFLLALGSVVEEAAAPWAWLAGYLGAGLAGEIAGLAWQPTGAGNSVAICGLAGLLAAVLWTRRVETPRTAPVILIYWVVAVLMSGFPRLLFLWVALAALAPTVVAGKRRRDRVVAAGVALVALWLGTARNLHGAALAAGLVIGALTRQTRGWGTASDPGP